MYGICLEKDVPEGSKILTSTWAMKKKEKWSISCQDEYKRI
jgi:hypothetical protein